MQPYPPLHCQILRWIGSICRTLYLVSVSGIPLIRLNPLTRVKEVVQHLIKNVNVGVLTGRVGIRN